MYLLPVDLLAPRNPVCGILGVGFAFPGYDQVWAAMDGELGAMLRGVSEQIGLYCLDKAYDHGFRQITTRTKPINGAGGSAGLQDPPAGRAVSDLAVPPPRRLAHRDQLQRGVQRAADRLVDGQENPLVLIDTAKLYEVQKYCSLTSHVWAGFHTAFNVAAWKRLPPDLQEIVHRTSARPRWRSVRTSRR